MRQHASSNVLENTLTMREILDGVNQRYPITRTGLRSILIKIQVSPIGKIRVKPMRYPPDTVDRVLDAVAGRGVVTMRQLRAVKRQVALKARVA